MIKSKLLEKAEKPDASKSPPQISRGAVLAPVSGDRVVLWVDSLAADLAAEGSPIRQACAKNKVRLVALSGTAQLKSWLELDGPKYAAAPQDQVGGIRFKPGAG